MRLRNAVVRATEIVAACPIGGTCSQLQRGQGVIWLSCGHYQGRESSRRGVKVRCGYDRRVI